VTLSPHPGGVVGGVQAGYNWQIGCFVVGIEADLSVSGMSGSQNVSPIQPLPFGVLSAHEDINWFGTVRPRLGYLLRPNVLVYATGGLAYGNASYSANTNFIPGSGGIADEQYPASFSSTKVGWTLGAGVEYAFSKCWTVKAEYLYMDLGSESVTANPTLTNPPFQMGYNMQTTANIFQIGVNYKAPVSSQTAPAAEESAQSFNWTGPYAGVHLGYGWGNADTNILPLPTGIPGDQVPSTVSTHPGGVVGGAQAGYNYQMGCFVVGIEADLSMSGMSGSQNTSPIFFSSGPPFPGVISAQENINWFGTLRPRLGYTVRPNMLIYATGGLAYGDVSYSANCNFGPGFASYPASFSTTKVGWTVGGGVEYAVSKCWTIKAEYMYMDLGSESAIAAQTPPAPPLAEGYTWNTTANIFQVGVNYKF
jgi:outer membrane immunogenic protein